MRVGPILLLLAACGGTKAEEPRVPAPSTAPEAPIAKMGARRHPDEAPDTDEARSAVGPQSLHLRRSCDCGRP
jgi:hypothetical protein